MTLSDVAAIWMCSTCGHGIISHELLALPNHAPVLTALDKVTEEVAQLTVGMEKVQQTLTRHRGSTVRASSITEVSKL